MAEQLIAGPANEVATPFLLARPRIARRSKFTMTTVLFPIGIAWLALVVILAVITPFLPIPSYEESVGDSFLAPAWGDFPTLLGTDAYGRSTIIRLMYGARSSLLVSFIAVGVSFVIGLVLGSLGGYVGGRLDRVIRVFLDAALAFPPLVLLLAVTAVLVPSVTSLSIALALVVAPSFARLARSSTVSLREEAFVQASRSLGATHLHIIFRETVPNVISSLISYIFLMFAVVMVAEGSLSFLGRGVPPPNPTWGGMINDGRAQLATTPMLVIIPSIVLVATILSLNIIGDRLQRGKR